MLVVGWVLVLVSILVPPLAMESNDIGRMSMGFRPVWELFGSDTGISPLGMWSMTVNWSVLVLSWVSIGLAVTAGLWVCRNRD